MPVSPTYPGLYIEEVPSSARTITAAPTSITVFVGFTDPFAGENATAPQPFWNTAQRINSFTEFERKYGGLYRSDLVRSDVPDAVYQFFLNGGADAYVVALQPKYLDAGGVWQALPAATQSGFGGVTFTAKRLTSARRPIRVTIRNVRSVGGGTDNLADLTISFGNHVETYGNVHTRNSVPAPSDPYAADYIGTKLAGSSLVSVASTGAAYPAAYSVTPSTPYVELGAITLPAGATVPLNTQAFTNVFQANGSLDKVDVFNLLVIPGISTLAIQNEALSFCQRKLAFYIMDPPESASADGMGGTLTLIEDEVRANNTPTTSPNGALYFPYLKQLDPLSGDRIHVAPSGYVAGIYARTDNNRGVWKAPAGLETTVIGTSGVVDQGVMTDMKQGVLNDLGVNVLRSFPAVGTVVWGARTIVTKNDAFQQWRYIPVRRMALFIEQTLMRNLKWVVFEPNDRPLWTAIRISIENFMLSLHRQHAFQGDTPSKAFLVQCDETTTTQTDIDNGIVNIVVGFRPLKPAEFVIIKIAQLAGQTQA
jgi:uncharacterized protein